MRLAVAAVVCVHMHRQTHCGRSLVQMGAVSIVDGAHAIGNVGMDVSSLGADAYATNLHTWLCTPKGTALLWVAEELQPRVKPLVASLGAGLGFVGEHFWTGTADLAGWLAVPAVVQMHERFGFKAQCKLRQSILEEGVAVLLKKFQCGLFCRMGCTALPVIALR